MLACIRCGLCLTSCPTYVLTNLESESPRGRVGMARALAEGHLDISPSLIEHELNCLVCDACSAICPAGVHMDPLQVVLRAALEQHHTDPRRGPSAERWSSAQGVVSAQPGSSAPRRRSSPRGLSAQRGWSARLMRWFV